MRRNSELPSLPAPKGLTSDLSRYLGKAEVDDTERVAIKTPYRFNMKSGGNQQSNRPESVHVGKSGENLSGEESAAKDVRQSLSAHPGGLKSAFNRAPQIFCSELEPEVSGVPSKVEFFLSDGILYVEKQGTFDYGTEYAGYSEVATMTNRSFRKLPPIQVSHDHQDGATFINPEFLLKSRISWGDSSHTKCVESFEKPWWLKRKGLWIPDKISEENPYFAFWSGASFDEKYISPVEVRESTYQIEACDRFLNHMFSEKAPLVPVEKKKKPVKAFKFWERPPQPITKTVRFLRRSAEFVEFPPLFEERGEAAGDLVMPHVWKCLHCKDTFEDKTEYDKHQQHFHTFVCKIDDCGDVFISSKALEKHKISSHVKKFEDESRPPEENASLSSYIDENLDMDSLETSGFGQAEDIFAKLIVFGCGVCQKRFPDSRSCLEHFQTHELFGCDQCRDIFDSSAKLHEHKLEKHSVSCSICDERFLADEERKQHVKDEHGFCCSKCAEWYLSQKELDAHFLTVHGIKCPTCTFKFATEEEVRQHVEIAHAPKFVCPLCKQQFATQQLLVEHRDNEHTPKIPCPECNKMFMTDADLEEHMKSHPLVPCADQNCEQRFFTQEEAEAHFADAHAPKLPCDKCDQKFFTAEEVKAHQAEAHPRVEKKKRKKIVSNKKKTEMKVAEPEPEPVKEPSPEPPKEPTPPPTPPPVKTLTPPPLPEIEEEQEESEQEESEEEVELPGLSKAVDKSRLHNKRKRAMNMYINMSKSKVNPAPKPSLPPPMEFDDFDFLQKYCIFNKDKYESFKAIFQQTDADKDGWLSPVEILTALKVLGGQFDIDEKQADFIFRILEMADYSPHFGADFQLFCIVASLAQKIQSVDDFMKSLIKSVDLEMLSSRIFKLKQFFLANVDDYSNAISIGHLMLELKAGGISEENERKVYEKLAHLHCLNLLDFMTYTPLFILIHDTVIDNPLSRAVAVN